MSDSRDALPPDVRMDTRSVRGGMHRSNFDETAEALFLTQGYVYGSAEEAEASFKGEIDRFVYSRYGNPTVAIFEKRLAAIEGAEDCYATASGMAAVFNSLLALVKAGDHVVAPRALFGSCVMILRELLPRFGVRTTFVDGDDLDQWQAALSEPTAAVFFESPSNPMLDLIDIPAVGELAHAAGAKVIADNVFASPVLSHPLELGCDIVVYSATKHIDGQGRVLGGAILGSREYVREQVMPFIRHTGPSLSPFNAWVLLKGLETLRLRVQAQTDASLDLAAWLEAQPAVRQVRYPYLPSHPHYELAKKQMSGGGTVITFTLADDTKEAAFRVLDALRIVDIANNLGDVKSLVTHPATTTHRSLGPEGRAKAGITDGAIRLSVGLEDREDLREDLERALAAA